MEDVQKSLWSLHLAVVLLGVTALFSRIIPLSALDITFGRSVVACGCLFLLLKFTGKSLKLHSYKDLGIGVLLGVIMALHWVTYFAAMQYSSVAVGMIALFTFPVITVFLEPFFEKVRLVWQDVVSALVVLLGITLIVPDSSLNNDVTLGIVVGVFSALLYSLRNLIHRRYFSHYSGAHAMTLQTFVIILCLGLFTSEQLYAISLETLFYLVVLGSICTAIPHALIASSLKHLRAKTFSLIACAQPLYGVGFAYVLLQERPSAYTLVGGLLVISAAVYETINAQKHRAKAKGTQ
ncbi:DMT family transporter [Planctobacterium marinum]|uniref:Permease n=1 Tax=Planctobacterium marinum TaxID=1631968 RepID=A0AA48HKA1_9ALTE|nr:permease [Planctobacterium marinum]